MSTVFIGKISPNSDNKESIVGDGDAATNWVNLDDLEQDDLGFDHKKILKHYNE